MVTEVVVDSSVIVALATLEEFSQWAAKKMSEYGYFHIPDLNYYEIANAIRYKKSATFDEKEAQAALAKAIKTMNLFGVHSFSEVVVDAMNLSLELKITVYNAAFLVLADKLELSLLTVDFKLARKLENTKYYGLIEYPNKHSQNK